MRQPTIALDEEIEAAVKAGLQPHECLQKIANHSEYSHAPYLTEALALFVSSLCGHKTSDLILEYTSLPFLLTARIGEADAARRLSVVAANKMFAKILRNLFAGQVPSIFESLANLPPATTYGSIVCMPPPLLRRPFGGKIIRELAPHLSQEGTLYWITRRSLVFKLHANQTVADLEAHGLHVVGCIETAGLPNRKGLDLGGGGQSVTLDGVVVIFRREVPKKRFVGIIHNIEMAESAAGAFLSGSRKGGRNWSWLDPDDSRTFSDLEETRVLQKLFPGNVTVQPLRALLHNDQVEKADRPISDTDQAAAFLYIPEWFSVGLDPKARNEWNYVSAGLDRPGNASAFYRVSIDPKKANPRFLARLLNGPFGRRLRQNAPSEAWRIPAASLLELKLPIPDIATQDRIVRIDSDISLSQTAFREMRATLDQDWTSVPDIVEKIDSLKAVLDIERQIADWWRELPYPLATIYRRYQVSTEPKDRFDTLLHFFEMASVYLAAVGTSHVKALRPDWQDVLAKWLHPPVGAGIERTDFGFWINLAAVS